ncbi:UDP-N-acetylmuramoyl-L-alanyl-D-glutamate--2,6-diaminopimelate ligase [Candidatus Erwinia haradaeae]|uniref:UDP-N-acetylmuramoyl-L-alanyl-D-glutamate--2,6-diaminopimelate ligase n=1 Tax=Candidatus Erwinia haradaeae TaxID=1922217 RepID=A0A451D892_9GAMM|nr:UDP-N-acetylmuramoyl-L-alanyl-D-glutamate--2,6-diaminopimelate ligase [Candidatus Erwinia haradaeae]VFP82037.1 UDP-N-acetylmuramoyl-L-alanyl-D-glutamate--2, 6-diaminopimelate ligase [Candidatus Erwinia haradaeae]
MENHNLNTLLNPWILNAPHCALQSIKLDSRKVTPGDLFVAIKGHDNDGRLFISQAIANGAVAVIAETHITSNNGQIIERHGIPIIYLTELPSHLSVLSGRFYHHPSDKMTVIGVTGTNGKTTITHLIAQWVSLVDQRSAIMGTNGNGLYGKLVHTTNTTSSAIDIQKFLVTCLEKTVNLVAIEVSSHGLIQHRVAALNFSAAIFTNLSHDHLDYHGNISCYEDAKWLLFSTHKTQKIIINADDAIGKKWLLKLPNAVAVTINNQYPIKNHKEWLNATKIKYNKNGISVNFESIWGSGYIKSSLIGSFNISNLLISLATLLSLSYPLDKLIKTASQLQPPFGRMEIFKGINQPKIIVDYAHTPDALQQALIALRSHCQGQLWCIFGCGGNRDIHKRALMGAIVEKLSDVIIITNDNPRNENPKKIIQDILSGFVYKKRAKVIMNRVEAISYAVITAQKKDTILLAGKGSENYQIIGTNNFSYSDRHIVASLVGVKA